MLPPVVHMQKSFQTAWIDVGGLWEVRVKLLSFLYNFASLGIPFVHFMFALVSITQVEGIEYPRTIMTVEFGSLVLLNTPLLTQPYSCQPLYPQPSIDKH